MSINEKTHLLLFTEISCSGFLSSMATNTDLQEPKQQSLSTPPPPPSMQTPLMSPMPLQLSGFLSGDTIQVQGDAGDLQFSVQLNITKKLFRKVGSLDSPGLVAHNPENFSIEDSSFSTYVTPIGSEEEKDQCPFAEPGVDESCRFGEEGDGFDEKMKVRERVVTRLRSGVISKVTYYPPCIRSGELRCCEKVKSRKKKSSEKIDKFERLLRRRSCPVKPCTSYAFFVMATWGVVKSSSFGETSKRVSQMWYKLSHKEKKLYQELALKDNARYQRQCKLLKSKAV
ncbi:High mobility group box domain containing protein [Trema orientale]|uniref:High mobility group box domain containing protein n=1 Tax=Trema orientale TaxID=63057 RepID=A0A2P5F3V2_TREOI|nr:High mobility group box domain containing protein [Trema orientale]